MARTEEQKRDAAKDARLKRFFRTTLDEYRAIEGFQREDPDFKHLLGGTRRGLDHDHTNGLVRGVLDWRINRALGIIENAFGSNSANVLRAMAFYLYHPPAVSAIGRRFGIIGKAKVKKVMLYGSENGPLPPIKVKKKRKKREKKQTFGLTPFERAGYDRIGNTD